MTSDVQPLSIDRAATLCGCDRAAIERLVALGLVAADDLTLRDVNGIRLMLSFEGAGIGLETFAEAVRHGVLSLEFGRNLMPDAAVVSPRSYTEACADLGVDFASAAQVFVAAGFPVPVPASPAREDAIAFLRLMATLRAAGISEDALTRILRVFGHSTRRMADAMRDLFQSEIEAPMIARGLSAAETMAASSRRRVPLQTVGFEAIRLLTARFVETVVFENVTRGIQNALTAGGLMDSGGAADPAVAFVDLVGFSALTRRVGDREAALQVLRFEALAQETVARFDGRIVKSLGDGLLLLFPDPAAATGACRDLIARLAGTGLPDLHIGLTVGPVIHRDGDIFGNVVNLAARLAGLSGPSEIVADAASVEALGAARTGWEAAGTVTPKGMAETAIYRCAAVPGT